ncbi:MAG TPA: hypothetical protein VGE98_10800 [Thermoanaerobaculia bacterium]
MSPSARFAAGATAILLLLGLVAPELLSAVVPGAGSACGRSARDCCCRPGHAIGSPAPMHLMPQAERGQRCLSRGCSLGKPSAPAATLSPEREVFGRAVSALAGSPKGALPIVGRVAQLALACPSGPPRLPPLPPPRLLAA